MVFKGRQEIKFPQDENANVLVIFGENMRGKTCLLNALRWCFYGDAQDRQKKSIEPQKLINIKALKDGEKEVSVEIEFSADGHEYFLKREIKFDSDNKASIQPFMREDDRVVKGGEVPDLIDYLIPEQLSRFFLFDGELLREYEDLVVAESSQQAVRIKQSIDKNLGLPVLNLANSSLKEVKKKLNKDHTNELMKNKHLVEQAKRLEEYEDKLDTKQKELIKVEELVSKQNDRFLELKKELDDSRGTIALALTKENIDKKIKELDKDISSNKEQLKTISFDLWRYPLKLALKPKMEKLDDEIKDLKSKRNSNMNVKFELSKLEETLNQKECQTCGHEISEEEKQKISVKIEKIKPTVSDLNEVENKLKEAEILSDKLMPISNIGFKLETLSAIRTSISEKIHQKLVNETELSDVREQLKNHDEQNAKETRIEHDRLLEERTRNSMLREDIKKEIDDIQRTIDSIKATLRLSKDQKSTSIAKRSQFADQLQVIFEEAKSLYINLKRKEIQERATKTFRNLTTIINFDALEINESYGLNLIIDGIKDPRSAGAEQIVALSLIEALNHLGRRRGPMLMDTPSGRLDMNHRKNIMNHLPNLVTQLAIFAHSGELDEKNIYFDERLIGKTYRLEFVSNFHSEIKEG